jgi:UDP-glucose 4-epimerase
MIDDNRTITVFGGSGFLGGHVSDQLSKSGYNVRIYDKQKSPWIRDDQEMIIGDLLDIEAVSEAIKDSDVVYNFAAVADLNDALSQPIQTMQVNVLGNLNVLEACKEHEVKRFIYASTVYVNSREGGFYRISKQTSEQLVEEYQKLYGLDYTILRYGSIYGPRSDEHNGLFRIVNDAVKTGVVRYEGHPESLREYVHVEDVARASVTILKKEFCNENIVLTGQEGMRVYDMLKMLAEIMGIPDQVEFNEARYKGHYVRTPYAYEQKIGRKYIPSLHVDLGQGLLQLINEVQRETGKV